jgi:hypothetical protein
VTEDGYDLRVGLMLDRRSYGWLVYVASSMQRLGWGEAATMEEARTDALGFVRTARALAPAGRAA